MVLPKKYENTIRGVLTQVHPDHQISSLSKRTLSDILSHMSEKISHAAVLLTKASRKNTVSAREIETATRLILPGSLARYSISEALKVVTRYGAASGRNAKGNRSKRAGLVFSVAREKNELLKVVPKTMRIGEYAPVYLTTVIEYLAAEILELAGNLLYENPNPNPSNRLIRVTVKNRDIFLAIKNDEELRYTFKFLVIKESGVIQNIHSSHLKSTGGSMDVYSGITKPVLMRMAHRAGVKNINGLVYEELRGILGIYLEEQLNRTITIAQHNDKKILKVDDLVTGSKVASILNYDASNSKLVGGSSDSNNVKTKRRNKPGTVALRDIKKQQKKIDLIIPKEPFKRLVIDISKNIKFFNIKFSKEFLDGLQILTENYIIVLLQDTDLVAIHAGRQTITPKDLQLVREIRQND